MSFLEWKEQQEGRKNDKKIKDLITSDYLMESAITPEDLLIEKERLEEIAMIIQYAKDVLKPKEFEVLWLSIIENKTQEEIAGRFKVTQQAIQKYQKRILQKIRKSVVNDVKFSLIIEDVFCESQSTLTANSPTVNGYVFEFLQNVNDGGEWKQYKDGRKRYISKTKCALPEYFNNSFNDEKTKCSLCILGDGEVKCTRKEVNNDANRKNLR